jgi:3'(2'), 5'-bisphosphate nucleotidase
MPSRPGYVEKIWDHAAGVLIAQEAGAVVSDVEGRPLDFSCGPRLERNRGVVCASPAWHERIIASIADLDLARPVVSEKVP